MGQSTVPDLGEGLTHHYLIFSKTDTACTQHKMGMALYLGGVHCPCRYRYCTFICHKYHVKHTPKQLPLESRTKILPDMSTSFLDEKTWELRDWETQLFGVVSSRGTE